MPKPLTQRAAALKHGWRSGLEEKVAAQLTRLGITFTYEAERLDYIQPETPHKYTPDFIVTTRTGKEIVVETKGRFLEEDRKKHLWVRASHPDRDIRFVFTNPNAPVRKGARMTYADWCQKHGFQFAKALIPEDWLNE